MIAVTVRGSLVCLTAAMRVRSYPAQETLRIEVGHL